MSNTIPKPKYDIGDTVYVGRYHTTTASYPCPDCLGSRQWEVRTPGGETFNVACERCPKESWLRILEIPTLQYSEHVPYVQKLTVGSIRIDTGNAQSSWSDDVVQYMCCETGVGSGTIWNESQLYASKELALRAATIECDEKNAQDEKTPERITKMYGRHLRLCNAAVDHAERQASDAKYKLGYFKEDIAETLKDDSLSAEELRSAIRRTCGIEETREDDA